MTIRENIEKMEQEMLSPYATLSIHSKGRERKENGGAREEKRINSKSKKRRATGESSC